MSTRLITSEDAAAAAEVVRLARQRPNDMIDPFPPSKETEVLVDMGTRKSNGSGPRVAIDGANVVGYGALDYSPDMKRAQLVGPVVHPAHRTKGHGRNLLADLIEMARKLGQKYVRASVGARNGAGQALLKASGFRQKERHTCIRMKRSDRLPTFEMEGVRVDRVDAEMGETYFEFTQRLVPRLPKQARSLLKADEYVAMLAYKGDKPVGCVEVDTRFGDTASVETLDAPPSLLHKGLGNALLCAAIHVAFANERIQYLDFLMSGTDRARLEALTGSGFEVRHELVGYELRL